LQSFDICQNTNQNISVKSELSRLRELEYRGKQVAKGRSPASHRPIQKTHYLFNMSTRISRQSPFTPYERRLIATAVNQANGIIPIAFEDIWTIRSDSETATTWVHLYDGRQLPFDRNQFKDAIDIAKKVVGQQLREERKANRANAP